MTLLAAGQQAPSLHDQLVITVAALGAGAFYLLRLYLSPYADCPAKHRRRRRSCRRCGGTGRVLRPGARLLHSIRHNTRRDS